LQNYKWIDFLILISSVSNPILANNNLANFGPELTTFLKNKEILIEAQMEKNIRCDECEQQCLKEPYFKENNKGEVSWFIHCPEEGPKLIDSSLLRRWRIDFKRFAEIIANRIGFLKSIEKIITNSLFFLGQYPLKKLMIPIYFFIGLNILESQKNRLRKHSILIVPIDNIQDFQDKSLAEFAHLNEFSDFENNNIHIDKPFLENIIRTNIIPSDGLSEIPEIKDFRYSPDFHGIYWKEKIFKFNKSQAIIVKALFKAYLNKASHLGGTYLSELAGREGKQMKDIFKNHPAWKTLIIGKSGNYRLNL